MTDQSTPLTEVAGLLSRDAARVLMNCEQPVQESVLRMVRTAVWSFERRGHTLDPIELDIVLDVFVGSVTPLAARLYEIGMDLK